MLSFQHVANIRSDFSAAILVCSNFEFIPVYRIDVRSPFAAWSPSHFTHLNRLQ